MQRSFFVLPSHSFTNKFGLKVVNINASLCILLAGLGSICSSPLRAALLRLSWHLFVRVDCWICLLSRVSWSASGGSWSGRHLRGWTRSWPSRCTSLSSPYSWEQSVSHRFYFLSRSRNNHLEAEENVPHWGDAVCGCGEMHPPDGHISELGLAWLGTALQWRLGDSWHRFVHQHLLVLHLLTWVTKHTPNSVRLAFLFKHLQAAH